MKKKGETFLFCRVTRDDNTVSRQLVSSSSIERSYSSSKTGWIVSDVAERPLERRNLLTSQYCAQSNALSFFFLLLLTLKFPLSEMREALISWKGLELILVSLNRPHLIQCVFFISSFLKMGGVFFGSWEKKFNSCLSQVFGDEEPEPPKRQKRNSMKRSWV